MLYKRNKWNEFFHKNSILRAQREADKLSFLVGISKELINELSSLKSLEEILYFHKKIWALGYQHENIGPCPYGMFRTKDINKMQPSEVYLGNIHGLFTYNISFYKRHKDEKISISEYLPETTIYQVVMDQYKAHLRRNIDFIAQVSFNKLQKYIAKNYKHIKQW